NEVSSGIQIIKMYAWEKPFQHIIKLARMNEIDVITKASYLRGVYMRCMVFIERMTLFLTITCYVLLGKHMTDDRVISISQYSNVLQLAMALRYPMAITFGAETFVSIKRLQDFLQLEEKPESTIQSSTDGSIKFTDVDASWTDGGTTLQNLNLI